MVHLAHAWPMAWLTGNSSVTALKEELPTNRHKPLLFFGLPSVVAKRRLVMQKFRILPVGWTNLATATQEQD
jgi:hypothetical protein